MKLTELEPRLYIVSVPGAFYGKVFDDALATAQGIMFECPKCHDHQIRVWFSERGVPEAERPTPRWVVRGTSFADLTLLPSINLVDEDGVAVACGWHGFVTNGEIT